MTSEIHFPDPTSNDSFNPFWNKYMKYSLQFFTYMKEHLDEMLEGGTRITHFHSRESNWWHDRYNNIEFHETYSNEIHDALLSWIVKEWNDNRLLEVTNWKPFCAYRDDDECYLGYRILFPFRQFYLQLILDDKCDITLSATTLCSDCRISDVCDTFYVHFSITIYGTQDGVVNDDSRYFLFNSKLEDLSNGMVPDMYWRKKW